MDPLRVLIVDDSEDDAALMTRELRRSGFDPAVRRVETAEAMHAALADRSWAIILADYRMPAFSGTRALELLQASGLDIPFILVSGTVGEETAVAMMKAGASDFVLKHKLGRLGPAVARELREAEMRKRRRWAEAALETLAEAGKLMVEAPEFDVVVRRAAAIAVPRLADWSIVYVRGPKSIGDATAFAGAPNVAEPALASLADDYRPTGDPEDAWLGAAIGARKPELLATVDEADLARLARDAKQLALLRALAPGSLMIIPLNARDHAMGVLLLAAEAPGRYGAADLGVASEIGGRIALLFENARLSRDREEFISAAIHEIKTPITVIKTAVQLMEQMTPAEREQRVSDLLARLDRQCNRLDRLVTQVLEISRLDLKRLTLARRPTDLAAMVERIADEMRDVNPKHQIVIVRNDAMTVDVDPDRVEQVLTNLVTNAIKYSPAGTRVEIESRRGAREATVAVRDFGIGIPREKQAHLFERFYRAHVGTAYEHASSLGVGLYLCREFVARHGGRMWFESVEGKGSTFGFTLPFEVAR
jgi:signal transduction histidine kinase/FixJ family two-component response regulator